MVSGLPRSVQDKTFGQSWVSAHGSTTVMLGICPVVMTLRPQICCERNIFFSYIYNLVNFCISLSGHQRHSLGVLWSPVASGGSACSPGLPRKQGAKVESRLLGKRFSLCSASASAPGSELWLGFWGSVSKPNSPTSSPSRTLVLQQNEASVRGQAGWVWGISYGPMSACNSPIYSGFPSVPVLRYRKNLA